MKIEILKKDNDDNIYYKIGEEIKKLNFNNIKEISMAFLDLKKNGEKTEYEVISSNPELALYKTTLENIINSICSDEELLELYKENSDSLEDKTEVVSSKENDMEEVESNNESLEGIPVTSNNFINNEDWPF